MTALQLNAELYRNLGIIAEDESMLTRAAKYIRRLAKQITDDPTMLDEAEKGPTYKMLPNESVDDMLKRLGYV